MGEHSCRVGLVRRDIGGGHRLLSAETANRDSRDLDRRLRYVGNAQNPAGGWLFGEIRGEDFVQFRIVSRVFQINLNINDMLHREPGGFDDFLDVVERLANLVDKFCGSRAISTARSLRGNINIVSGIHAIRAEGIARNASCLRERGTWFEEQSCEAAKSQ